MWPEITAIWPSAHPTNYRSGYSKHPSTLQNRFNTIESYHTIPNWLLVGLSSVVVKFFSSNVLEYQISLVITSLKSFQSHSFCHHLPIQPAFQLLTWSISNTVLHLSKMIFLKKNFLLHLTCNTNVEQSPSPTPAATPVPTAANMSFACKGSL